MVRAPRFARLRIPRRLTQRWRARLRAQRRWWRNRWRETAPGEVMFPTVGGGVVAVETLAGEGDGAGPRIAILHATAGAGHKRAAQALAAAIAEQSPHAVVREADTLVFASRFYRGTYASSYNTMAARAPRLWGALYHSWESAPVNRGTAPVRLALDRINLRRLVRVVEREQPDAIVCTHFLPVEALSPIRGRGRLQIPLYVVITDFTAHPIWAFPHVDRYFVASDSVAMELAGHGVPRGRIEVTGIPIDPRFAKSIGRDAARAHFDLDARRPTVLVMGGGAGVGPLTDLATTLAKLALQPQIVVICGTNQRLLTQLRATPEAQAGRIRAIGFTHEVDTWFEACDVVVSKAGGLTCSEALARQLPLVVFKPTPGQEVRNARFLEAGGAAVHADSVREVAEAVGLWLADRDAYARARQAAAALAHPNAAADIARRVLDGVGAGVQRLGA
jgi:processive 1,2-diacylglycerol beta-glucosyltransferase